MTAEQAKQARRQKLLAAQQDEDHGADEPTTVTFREQFGDEIFQYPGQRDRSSIVGTALGAFSIGLGIAQIVAPRKFARMVGIKPNAFSSTAIRLCGMREIGAGIGMVFQPQRPEWAWARVAGDLVDVAALTRSSRNTRNNKGRLVVAAASALAITGLDIARASQLRPRRKPRAARAETTAGIEVSRSITVNRPVSEVYEFWRNLENLPQFMDHLESVVVIDNARSQWKAKAPAGMTVSWEAELIEDQPNERIAWRSVEGSQIPNSGAVTFVEAPGDRGTEVHVELQYSPPAGKIGAVVAKLFGEEPTLQVGGDLRRFKQVMETGEVLLSDASLHSGMHAAQPSDDVDHTQHYEAERSIVIERSADGSSESSNRDRESTEAQDRADQQYNDELANQRSTF
ncbi:MAG: SRPBCC family protein [Phycisphaerae bacterium]|nr:SRPBCC family protein [Gemmatimonadaceae bacterium]